MVTNTTESKYSLRPKIEEINDEKLGLFLQTLYHHAPISRPELSELLGLTRASIGLYTKRLKKMSLITKAGLGQSSGGRIPFLLDVERTHNCTLSFILHDGTAEFSIVDFADNQLLTDTAHVSENIQINDLLQILDRFTENAFDTTRSQNLSLRGSTIVAAAGYYPNSGKIQKSTHFPCLADIDLEEYFRSKFSLKTYAIHFSHAVFSGIISPYMEKDRVGLLNWSQGISWMQAQGEDLRFCQDAPYTGQFNHIKLPHGHRKCYCGQNACIEAELSGKAILNRLAEIHVKYANLEIDDIAQLINEGDHNVKKIVLQAARILGELLSIQVLLGGIKFLRIQSNLINDKSLLISEFKEGLSRYLHHDMLDSIDFSIVDNLEQTLSTGAARLARMIFFDKNVLSRLREKENILTY